jgi:hypothetical protein
MKLNNINIFIIGAGMLLASCNDLLDQEPISDNVNVGFFTAANQLQPYCNAKYDLLPVHEGYGIGTFAVDNNSDNQAASSPNNTFLPQMIKVPATGSYGNHGNLRDCNHFLESTAENLQNNTLANSSEIQQYIGEMYFFRAYIYFNYLKTFGDFPILTKELDDGNYDQTVELNKRKPRNEVARFIIQDLDSAIKMMQPRTNALTSHRLNRESAYLFKSRVALYEASWETYHKGTARVPGGPNWPGGTFSGNLDTEIKYFLGEAMSAAKAVADATALSTDYAGMFNKENADLNSVKEVLLYRMYSETAKTQNLVEGYLHTHDEPTSPSYKGDPGSGTGYTRSLVESFLMKNGLPIYANGSTYSGDVTLQDVCTNRDSRLVLSMSKPGDKIFKTWFFNYPNIIENSSTTGYVLRKGWADNNVEPTTSSPLSCVIFRAAEAYLNYIEADCMLNNCTSFSGLDANSQKYWKAIRTRAGISTDIQATIDATDLSKENDLAKYSGTSLISTTLYNIRRERRDEFIAEGFRKDDLFRWRALDMMQNYQVEGFNYWDKNYLNYTKWTTYKPVDKTVSKYLRPYANNELAKVGYNFEVANYLSPISIDVFRNATPVKGGDVSTSVVYQNPGWPMEADAYSIK